VIVWCLAAQSVRDLSGNAICGPSLSLGSVLAERVGTGQYQVTFQRDDVESCETRSYDLLIIRHGPEGVIRQLIPDSAVKELGLWWTENEDVTTKAYWRTADPNFPHQFFREYTTETVPP